MTKTQSESLFERFCDLAHIRKEPIPTKETGRTPDYFIWLPTQTVVEVKEITPNKEDNQYALTFIRGDLSSIGGKPGARVRSVIDSAKEQIRILAKDRYPSLLVIYNATLVKFYTEAYSIKVGMYGFDTLFLRVGAEE